MSIDRATAATIRDTFGHAADRFPIRQLTSEMRARRNEWHHALDFLIELDPDDDGDWTIELVGAVVPFMRFAWVDADGGLVEQTVDRLIHRDGGVAVQFTDGVWGGKPKYVNRISAASPLVVRATDRRAAR